MKRPRRRKAATEQRQPLFSTAEWRRIVAGLGMTTRQAQIVRLILEEKRDKQIARELRLSVPTVRTHLARACARNGAAGRLEFVICLFRWHRSHER